MIERGKLTRGSTYYRAMTSYSGGKRAGAGGFALPACLFVVLCGACSSDAAPSGLLDQAPRCPEASVLRIEGTIEGSTLSDTRTSNINAGLTNIVSPQFQTPISDLAPLQSDQLGLDISWANSLADGQVAAVTGGVLTLPANHTLAADDGGAFTVGSFCVSKGKVGFVSGGPEDGAFKFAISELWRGTNGALYPMPCPADLASAGGEALAVDVRGCFR